MPGVPASETRATSRPHTPRPSGTTTASARVQATSALHMETLEVTRMRAGETGGPKIDRSQSTKGAVSATQCCAVSTRA